MCRKVVYLRVQGNSENIIGKGNRFSSDNQPASRGRNGRKPSLYRVAAKAYGISLQDFRDVASWLMQQPRPALEAIAKSDTEAVWVVTVARALLVDASKASSRTISELADRLFGRSGTAVDITSAGKALTPDSITVEVVDKRGMAEAAPEPAK